MESSLRKYLWWSCGIHATVFFLIVTFSFFSKNLRLHQEKIIWVSLPKGISRQFGRPLKKTEGLPRTTIQEQKKAPATPPTGPKKPEMTIVSRHPEREKKPRPPQKKGEVDSKIEEALSNVERQVARKKAEPEAAQIPETQPGGFPFGSLRGAPLSPEDPEYVLYQAKIRQRIMNEWILPLKYAEGDFGLICKIIVHMNERGEVAWTEWSQKSGNPSFDLSALRAVEKASPLDIPPERLKYEVLSEGFIVEFNPKKK